MCRGDDIAKAAMRCAHIRMTIGLLNWLTYHDFKTMVRFRVRVRFRLD